MQNKKHKAIQEIKNTLDDLLGGFRTEEIVGRRLRLALEHIKKQIKILENDKN